MTDIQCASHPVGRGIADAIRTQIGLDAWLAVSARNPRWWTDDNGDVVLAFRFGNCYGLPHWCEITYQSASDDYDVYCYKVHRNGCKRALQSEDGMADWNGVYASSLGPIIREVNGQW